MNKEEIIRFYRARGKYGFLSCLYKKKLIFEGREFAAAEYAYQYPKSKNEEVREWAMKCLF